MSKESGLISRRGMVLGGAAALGAVGAIAARPSLSGRAPAPGTSGLLGPAAPVPRRAPPLGAMSNWSAAVGSDFFVRTLNGSVLTKLTAVAAFPNNGKRPPELARQEAFILFFDTGRVPAPQAEQIYAVTHRAMGEMKILLTPSTVSPTGLTAVFN